MAHDIEKQFEDIKNCSKQQSFSKDKFEQYEDQIKLENRVH